MIPLKLDYSIGSKVLYTTSSDIGELLKETQTVDIKAKSGDICQGIAFYVLASQTFTGETFELQCVTFYTTRTKIFCKSESNQEILSFLGEKVGKPIIFHSEKLTGMVEYGCVNESGDIELIVVTPCSSDIKVPRKLRNPNMRFIMFDASESEMVFSDMMISTVKEISDQASYGYSNVVYNRRISYDVSFASKKLKTNESKGEFLNGDIIYFDLFEEKVKLKDVKPPVFSEQIGTIIVNDLKLVKTTFVFDGDTKSISYSRGAYNLEIKARML